MMKEIEALDLSFSSVLLRDKFKDNDGVTVWSVTIVNDKSSLTTEYTMGSAYRISTVSDTCIWKNRKTVYRKNERLPCVYGGLSIHEASVRNRSVPEKPELEGVLYCLVMDAVFSSTSSFEEFCDNSGFDSDSVKAKETFEACQKTHYRLLKMGLDLDRLTEIYQDY